MGTLFTRKTSHQWMATIGACLGGGITMGSTIGYNTILINGLQEEKDPDLRITLEEGTWLVSIWAISNVSTCLLGGILADAWGRRRVILLSAIPFIISWLVAATATSSKAMLVSRVLAGLGDGVMYPIIPVYVTEITQPKLRASLNNVLNATTIIGMILDYSISLFLGWRTLAWIMIVPPIITVISMLLVPETPYWLVGKGKIQDAEKSMSWLRNGQDCEDEMNEIIMKAKENRSETTSNFVQKLKAVKNIYSSRRFYKPFAMSVTLFCLYTFSGFSMVNFYLLTVFKEAGSSIDGILASLIVQIWRLFISILATFALHRSSRRGLFLWTGLTVCISLAGLGTFAYVKELPNMSQYSNKIGWLPLVAVLSLYAGGQLGYNPIVKIVIAEVFPTEIRSTSTAIVLFLGNFCMAVATKLFAQFLSWFGFHGAFWLYSGFAAVSLVFGFIAMPETSGVSLVKIEEKYEK